MSKYIDERPFEEIVRATILDEKHNDYVDTILTMIRMDEESGWRNNPFRGDTTFYDSDIAQLKREKEKLKSELDLIQKHYDSVFSKIVDLNEVQSPEDDATEDQDDHEHEHVEMYEAKAKGKASPVRLKPAQQANKKKLDVAATQNFKSTLATLQDQLRDLMKKVRDTESELERYEYFQEVAVKCLRSLRRITQTYKETKDVEFVKKGAYFVQDYSTMLLNRFDTCRS